MQRNRTNRRIKIKTHASFQLKERRIPFGAVKKVINNPDQILEGYFGRRIAQGIVKIKGRKFLLRVVYEEKGDLIEIVTVYLTTKIGKYRR